MKPRQHTSRPSAKHWLIFGAIYSLIALADILVLSMESPMPYREVTKPMILIALMAFFVWKALPLGKRKERLFLGGLFFSFLGDGFLNYEGYFLAGLFSFFTAHIMYFLAFVHLKGLPTVFRSPVTYLTLIYALAIYLFLAPHLGALQPYVTLYMLILVSLMVSLLSRKMAVRSSLYIIGLTGGLLFLLSDSILALNKFAFSITLGPQLIMITYALAQFLLTKSFLEAES